MLRRFLLLSLAFMAAGLVVPAASAQAPGQPASNPSAVRQRMAERLPRLDALKRDKLVGENNRGFVEVRGEPAAADRELVDAENRDRTTVYALIARQTTGATAEDVGKTRAKKIAESSAPGVWLQDGAGTWYQKS